MLFFEIFFALWWIWLPLLIWFLISRNKKKSTNNPNGDPKDLLWHNYILSFKEVVKSKAEKNLLDAILTRKTAGQLYEKSSSEAKLTPQQLTAKKAFTAEPVFAETEKPYESKVPSEPFDGTLLLLYFGAFLLIASAGLFVAIGNLDGTVRTVVLAITTALLYMGGLWIYRTKKKLAQAGISFMGAGMMIAPLIGVAWYNLVAEQTNGAAIWVVTSIVCLILYIHAYSVIKNSFMAYLLIGSFVSSVESAVLAVALPTYVFAWTAILASLSLQFIGLWRGQSKTLLSASDTSARLLVPLSIFSSLLLLPDHGSAQLGITLLLAGGYYALLAWQRPGKTTEYSTASQLALISALSNITYNIQESFKSVAVLLGIITVVYILLISITKVSAVRRFNFIAIGALTSLGSIILSLPNAWPLLIYTTVGILLSVVIWLKITSKTALAVGGLLLLATPYLLGQNALTPHVSALEQLLLAFIPVLILGALTILTCKNKLFSGDYDVSTMLFISSTALVVIVAWIAGFTPLLITCILLALGYAVVQYVSKMSDWWVFSGFIVLVPIAYALIEYGIDDVAFSMAVVFGLLVNIAISLITRERAIRWLVVICILLTPLAIGGGGIGIHWEEAGYAGGYLLAMAGCVLARAIARGKLLVSSKVPISSYGKDASQAFVIGYILSAILATIISLMDDNSQIVSTLVLAVISAALVYIAYFVESNNRALLLLPLLLQGMLFSALRPELSDADSIALTALLSSGLAVITYILISATTKMSSDIKALMLVTCVATSYIGPSLVLLGADVSSIIPLSLTVAGILTVYHNRSASKDILELSLFVIVASIHWFLYLIGIDNVIVQAQILALFIAGLAYWRFTLKDKISTQNHIITMFAVATVPMVIKALISNDGVDYGVILIIQQISFMVIGILLNQRFLLKAGLWVALGSILYQLRGLGWAFLAIIAVILIGIAVYRLQKHED